MVAIVKNQQVQSSKGQGKKKSNGHSTWEKAKDNEKGGRNLRGPDTNSSGPFRNGSPPWQCYNCSGWGHRAFECSSPLKLSKGGSFRKEEANKQPPGQSYQCKSEQTRYKQKDQSQLRTIIDRYHNPDPIARLIGKRNESNIIVEGGKYPALLDSGAQMSTITISQAKNLGLQIQELEGLLDIEGGGGIAIPYIGYVEVNLKIPEIQAYNENVLMMVMDDSRYGDIVPFAIGTIHIHEALKVITDEEWKNLSLAWQGAALPAYASKAARMENFSLENVKGDVKAQKSATLPPFSTTFIKGRSNVKGHYKRINVATEHSDNIKNHNIAAVRSYSFMKPGSSKVMVGVRNLTSKEVVLKAGTVIGQIEAANTIPPMLAPKYEKNSGPEPNSNLKQLSHQDSVTTNPESNPSGKPMKLTQEEVTLLLSKLDLTGITDWSEDEQREIKDLIIEYGSIFALKDLDLGKTDKVKHSIKLTDYTPFKERYRHIPPHQYEEVKQHLKEMLEIGAISESKSPWASAVVLVRKKDGSLRFCIDLRKLNARTVKDAYSLPRIDETLDCLNGAQWFTSLDLKSGYWQVELDEDSKALTAFTVGPLGFYQCEHMPFGLTNAPATFQRLMESCLGDMHLKWVIIYLDDIIIFSKTPKEHIERVRSVFQKIHEAGLKLKPKKCEFFKTKISFLGHIVSRDGIECDPKKIEAIKKWKRPTTVHDVRSFLGFTNYYRRFINKYAQVAQPLNKLISGDNASKKHKKVDWDDKCEEAFLNLKEKCCKPPILAFADYGKPFKLHTDASGLGLGAILYQTQEDGTERVIAYVSRTLSKSERNYPAYKLEFLALKWSVCDRFHEYLYGGNFEVLTDNNPLTYILTTAKLDVTGQRWVANLANYNFSIRYKSGKLNVDADALSRNPWDVQIDPTIVGSIINYEASTPNLFESQGPNTHSLHSDLVIAKGGYVNHLIPQELEDKNSKVMTKQKWIEAQKNDVTINQLITLLKSKTLGHRKCHKNDSTEMKSMLRIKNQLVLRKGLLYRKIKKGNREGSILEFVVPTKYREQVLRACHDDVGHAGIWKCTRLLRNRFYWANVNQDMEQHIKRCDRCIRFKAKAEVAPLEGIEAAYPMELVHIDYLTIESNKSAKDVNVLVVTDHYTRLAQAFVTNTQTASTVAKTLWDKYFMYYGIPEKILSDQGRNFESSLIMELCKLTGIKKLRTTPYRPQTNGQCEKFNSTLINMIGTLPSEIKYNWQDHVNTLVHAYNCMDSTATKFSPYYLMFGREPNLPIDIEFGVRTPDLVATSTKNYVEKLRRRLAWAFKKAQEVNEKERKRNK